MESEKQNENTKVCVVGAGLVGALAACYMAKRGYEVHLYEYRKDIRTLEHVPGRSINLAMSVRGLSALSNLPPPPASHAASRGLGDAAEAMASLGQHVREEYGIPMRGRMIHTPADASGKVRTYEVPYGKEGQCIYSVGRRYLNEVLLTAGEAFPNLHYHFEHKLSHLSIDKAEAKFVNNGEEVSVSSDFVLGCDGAFSVVRRAMAREPYFDFSQEYIPHAYLELCIPPDDTKGDFRMPPNFLHIWPRGSFMLIALPNQDKSFTVTLFMPSDKFTSLTDGQALLSFFGENFPDAIPLIGADRLVADYFATKPSALISVKCSPYNWKDKCLLLGDAAHAMVPFYGQGMNCGMEDVLVLDDFLSLHPQDFLSAFQGYSAHRSPDARAICDLAMYNYVEMRDLVAKPSFLLRKKLDNLLHALLPSFWVPLYTSVTFTRMRYHQCVANKSWQDEVIAKMMLAGKAGLIVAGASLLWRLSRSTDIDSVLLVLKQARINWKS